MRNTQESLQGPLRKDLKNISEHLPSFMAMPTPQVIIPGWTISPLLVGGQTTSQGP